ncbi:hypothetical protein CRG98_011731 [Punica granatum]|uniref:Uncharacterized protein n=1 Tax=Punica granatum TaxID=22663 RepID=A0A2I0KI62_PUNGR|nr:hypothetical protein CRG98_011731 [Punica granatum]
MGRFWVVLSSTDPDCTFDPTGVASTSTGHPGSVWAARLAFRGVLGCSGKPRGCLTSLRSFWKESRRRFFGNQEQSQVSKTETDRTGSKQTRLAVQKEMALPEAPNGILMQGRQVPTPKRPTEPCKDQAKQSTPSNRPDLASFGSDVTTVAPDRILMQGQWLPTPKRPPEVTVVVVWFQSYRVDPYTPAKITKNRARPGNRPDWVVFGSDVTMVAPDGILMQGQWFPTPKRPLEFAVVVVQRKDSRIGSICKENTKTVRNPT